MKQKIIEQVAAEFSELKRVLFHTVTEKLDPNISQTQGELLFTVARARTIRVGDLAKEMKITSSACTQLVDALIVHNLLQREQDEEDRRIVHISLSAYGEQQINSLRKDYLASFTEVMDKLSEDDLQTLHGLLKKINSKV